MIAAPADPTSRILLNGKYLLQLCAGNINHYVPVAYAAFAPYPATFNCLDLCIRTFGSTKGLNCAMESVTSLAVHENLGLFGVPRHFAAHLFQIERPPFDGARTRRRGQDVSDPTLHAAGRFPDPAK